MQAADWVEYALATGPQPFLWPLEVGMPWWQLHFIDVAALVAAALAAVCAAAWCCLHACWAGPNMRSRASRGASPPSAQHVKSA